MCERYRRTSRWWRANSSSLFAAEGAKVLAVFCSDRVSAERVATEIQTAGGMVSLFQGDVSKSADTEAMAREAVRLHGRIDVLCSNAGVYPMVRLDAMGEDEWDSVLAINLKGLFISVKACLPQMQEQGCGKIVAIASTTGTRTAVPGCSHYGAAKAGILGFIRCACLELAKHNITINAVTPGVVVTEGLRTALGSDTDAFLAAVEKEIPLGRVAQPMDVAYAALFLASNESDYITGQELVVDGPTSRCNGRDFAPQLTGSIGRLDTLTTMPDVFISYPGADESIAHRIAVALDRTRKSRDHGCVKSGVRGGFFISSIFTQSRHTSGYSQYLSMSRTRGWRGKNHGGAQRSPSLLQLRGAKAILFSRGSYKAMIKYCEVDRCMTPPPQIMTMLGSRRVSWRSGRLRGTAKHCDGS